VLDSAYPQQVCSIARSLEVIGERWTLLILRDALLGIRRFDELVDSLGVTRTVLANRLNKLVAHDVLERNRYQQRPERFEYLPTDKALALYAVLAQLILWGDEYYPNPGGPPRLLQHRDCGGALGVEYRCRRCQSELEVADIEARPGPGASTRASRAADLRV